MKYKRGDIVKVWSLQSFFGGGFVKGTEGVVSQDQIGASVLVAVKRKMCGEDKIDPNYEVYDKQLELIHRPECKSTINEFESWIDELKRT